MRLNDILVVLWFLELRVKTKPDEHIDIDGVWSSREVGGAAALCTLGSVTVI